MCVCHRGSLSSRIPMLPIHDALLLAAHCFYNSARQEKKSEAGDGIGGKRRALTCSPASKSPLRSPALLITVNTRLVAGGFGAAWGSPGSNDGGQWPRALGDGLLVMIPCYLCRGRVGQPHPLSHSLRQLQLRLPLGEKWVESSKQRGVFARARGTPHPSTSSLPPLPLAFFPSPQRHNHSSLLLSAFILPSVPSGVLVQFRFSADIIL